MSGSPVETYQEAMRNLTKAVTELKSLIGITNQLKDWPALTLVNTPREVQGDFPTAGQVSLDMSQWPDKVKVTQAFADYYAAKRQLHSAWNALDSQQRTGLTPPDTVLDSSIR